MVLWWLVACVVCWFPGAGAATVEDVTGLDNDEPASGGLLLKCPLHGDLTLSLQKLAAKQALNPSV